MRPDGYFVEGAAWQDPGELKAISWKVLMARPRCGLMAFSQGTEQMGIRTTCVSLNLQLSPSVSVPVSSVVSYVGSGEASVWGRGLLSKNHSVDFTLKI